MTREALKKLLWEKRWALFALRLLVGFGFAAHGYAKLERGVEHFALTLAAMGMVAPKFMAWVTALVELCGGLSLMAGAFVVPLCLPFAIIMLTALVGVHLPYGFSSIRLRAITPAGAQFGPIGYELNLLYLAALLVLAVSPSAPLSFDAWLDKRRRKLHASA